MKSIGGHFSIGRCTLGHDRHVFIWETLQKKRTRVCRKKMLSTLASLGSTRHLQKWSRPSHAFRSLWPRSCRSPKLLWQVEMLLWPCPPQPSATRTLWTRRCSRLGFIRSPQRRQHLQRGLHGAASTREDAKREGIQKRVQAADFSAVADDAPTAQASSPAAGLDGMVTAAETWLRNLCGDVDAAAEKATHRRVRPSLALPLVYI